MNIQDINMTEIAVGVLIPTNIKGEHNEICGDTLYFFNPEDDKVYYYQAELGDGSDEAVEEGMYCEGVKVGGVQEENINYLMEMLHLFD